MSSTATGIGSRFLFPGLNGGVMSVLLFANGDLEPGDWLEPYLAEATRLIAVDGGLRHLQKVGRLPDLLIGDLDSISAEQLMRIEAAGGEIIRFPAAKDETDLELALLLAVERYAEPVVVLGAFGGRLDQHLANILLLTHEAVRDRPVKLVAPYQEMWLIQRECVIKGKPGDTVSLIPLAGDVHVQATAGLAWVLQDEWLRFGPARGISNVMETAEARVAITSGSLLCIHTDGRWQR